MDDILREAACFHRVIEQRNRRELVACGLVVLGAGGIAVLGGDPSVGLSAGLMAAGAMAVAGFFLTRGKPRLGPPSEWASAVEESYRRELLHQAELLDGVLKWYIGPFVPGLAWTLFHVARMKPWSPGVSGTVMITGAVIAGWVWSVNRRAASNLRTRADQLAHT